MKSNIKHPNPNLFGVPKRDLIILLSFYTLAHGGIFLLLNSLYWDDWVLWNTKPSVILDAFQQAGFIYNGIGYLHVYMMMVGPWLYKILTFLLVFISGIFLYRILIEQKWIEENERLYIVIFFLTTPLYAARIALIHFPYTLAIFLFFLGWLLIKRNRLLSLVCFAVSFNIQSLLVFYALPMIDWYFRENNTIQFKRLLKWAIFRIDYILLPLIWFFIKTSYFKPYGLYKGYNEHYSLANPLMALKTQFIDFSSLSVPVLAFILAVVVTAIAMKYFGILSTPTPSKRDRSSWIFIILAIIALAAGTIPYLILGHSPGFSQWSSRHQLLMPLGVALLLCGILVKSSFSNKVIVFASVISLSLSLNWSNFMMLALDWNKQNAIIGFLKDSKEVASADLIVFEDLSPNAFSRTIRFYEWQGMLKQAYSHTPMKFSINSDQLSDYLTGGYDNYFVEHYNSGNFQRKSDALAVKITISGFPFVHITAKKFELR